MGLTKAQATIWQQVRSLGSGGQAVSLTDGMCRFLLSTVVHDLGLAEQFPEFATPPPPFFTDRRLAELSLEGHDPLGLFERLAAVHRDADTYFACLATLHKARLKYEQILQSQPFPTLEQVGPRALLQYGQLSASGLAGLLSWRKWLFDVDNRAGQETGYLFEPIIAHALGGTPATSRNSPVMRRRDPHKRRQVDCLLDQRAYEFKIRVSIAASGQGRWQEELEFPEDCRHSGFTPVLVCLDGTPNPKLEALTAAFLQQGGEAYVGPTAWQHLDAVAGATMARFLELYVRSPLLDLVRHESDELPELAARCGRSFVDLRIGSETLHISRNPVMPQGMPVAETQGNVDEATHPPAAKAAT